MREGTHNGEKALNVRNVGKLPISLFFWKTKDKKSFFLNHTGEKPYASTGPCNGIWCSSSLHMLLNLLLLCQNTREIYVTRERFTLALMITGFSSSLGGSDGLVQGDLEHYVGRAE